MAKDTKITGDVVAKEPGGGQQLASSVTITGGLADVLARASASPRDVTLDRSYVPATPDEWFWSAIRNRTGAIQFANYRHFMDGVMCAPPAAVAAAAKKNKHNAHAPAAAVVADTRTRGEIDFDDAADRAEERHTTFAKQWDKEAFVGAHGYELLKRCTEAFLMQEAGVNLSGLQIGGDSTLAWEGARGQGETAAELRARRDEYLEELLGGDVAKGHAVLPYMNLIRQKLADLPLKAPGEQLPSCYGILRSKLMGPPLIELIWSYWMEQGMLVQTMNAISMRFQNRRGPAAVDPLASMEIGPLRPVNNLLWGYIEDEVHRLTLARRAYEYDHHYALRLCGKAVPQLRPADSRTRFISAFHELLHRATIFFERDDDTTVKADGFDILNALKDVHFVLTEGMHNQYGDLPWTARVEMLTQQWILSRPEMREFLRGRESVAYPEPWMGAVDAMKSLQGWPDCSVLHFRDLAVFGEQLLLSVRFGAWSVASMPAQAANWARYWRGEIQGYVHGYRAVTGVDLSAARVDAETLLTQRMAERYLTSGLRDVQPAMAARATARVTRI